MMDRENKWMTISGTTGLAFFLVANCTSWFTEINVASGLLQIAVNIFVFVCWGKAFRKRVGWRKAFAFSGIVVPIFMAGFTVWRVLIPALFKFK